MPTIRGFSQGDEEARDLDVLRIGGQLVLRLRAPTHSTARAPMDAVCGRDQIETNLTARPYAELDGQSEKRGAPRRITIGMHRTHADCTYVWIRPRDTIRGDKAGWDFVGSTTKLRAALSEIDDQQANR